MVLKKIRTQFKRLDRLTLGIMIGCLVIAIATSIIAFIWVRDLVLPMASINLPGAPIDTGQNNESQNTPDPNTAESTEVEEAAQSAAPAQSMLGPTPEPWDGASRVNILVMGLDFRDWEAGEVPRTDTMILFTIDPLSKTGGMLSIPRDMWVNIPGFDYGKINTAYYLGEVYQVPGGGPALAAETVEHFLGVPVHYYAQIDFYAFEKIIDDVGGVVLDIKEPLTIYPIGKPKVTLEVGRYLVGGDYALAYARTRYTEGGDFDRSSRQQEVIMELRYQAFRPENFPHLLANAAQIYQDISSGVRTNMTLNEALKLGMLIKEFDVSNINKAIISPDVVIAGFSPDGLNILIPIHDEIRLIRDQIFTTGGPLGPAAVADNLQTLVQQEQALVSVRNGTQTAGIANRTGEYLKSLGINVVEETNADQVYDSTTIIIYNGKPYAIRYISELMNVSTVRIINRFDPTMNVDIAVMVGNDWAASNPMP